MDLALAKIWYKFHGPRQIKQPFKSIWAMEIWDKFVSDHEIDLDLAKSVTKFMVQDKFVSDFQCSFLFVSDFSMLIITKLSI